MKTKQTDARPEPKPRKRAQLWQYYLIWDELVQMRKHHSQRLLSIERGKSEMDGIIETTFLDAFSLDKNVKLYRDHMIHFAKDSTPAVFTWGTKIKGLGEGSLLAQWIAQVDDITGFTNVSKLWRFAGYAVIDGKREHNVKGEKSHFNRRLKSICFLIGDQFIRQQTPVYVDIYYAEKKRQRMLHPEPVDGKYTDGHLHYMAIGKMVKIWMQHAWLVWRESEGLPVTLPYVIDIMGHSDYLGPAAAKE